MATKKKVCKQCNFICNVEEQSCPSCGSNNFANTVLGRMVIIDKTKSKIAGVIEAPINGEYAIKMR